MPFVYEYSLCESATATGTTKWHVRKLGPAGKKLGGGIDTPSLCLKLQPVGQPIPGKKFKGTGGWDLDVRITNHHLENNCCPECRTLLLGELHVDRL